MMRKYDDKHITALAAIYTQHALFAAYCAEHGLGDNIEGIRRAVRRYRPKPDSITVPTVSPPASHHYPASPPVETPRYYDPPEYALDDAIIISDIEMPDHDPVMIERAIATGRRYRIKTIILAGDILATDQSALSSHEVTMVNEGKSYRGVLSDLRKLIERLRKTFPRVIAIQGNHDDRVARKTGGEVVLGMFLDGAGVEYSEFGYCWVKTSARGYIMVSHPMRHYSANSAALGQRLYNASVAPDGSKPHVILAHTHQAQTAMSPDGTRQVLALGCMRDARRTAYIATQATAYPKWAKGYAMLKNGYLYQLVDGTVDWSMWT